MLEAIGNFIDKSLKQTTQANASMASSELQAKAKDLIVNFEKINAMDEADLSKLMVKLNLAGDVEIATELAKAMTKATAVKFRPIFIEKYPITKETTDFDICQILSFEQEKAKCEGCLDFGNCQKDNAREMIQSLEIIDGKVFVDWIDCPKNLAWRRQKALSKQLKNAHIPEEFRLLTFSDFRLTEQNKLAYELAKKCVETGKGLFLSGTCGVGKTMLASIIANEQIKRGKTVLFAAVPDLLYTIRSTFRSNSENHYERVISSIKKADVLILDDLGMENNSEWTSETLTIIINERSTNKTQTIITTNCAIYKEGNKVVNELIDHMSQDKDGFSKPYLEKAAERIYSRICKMCEFAQMTGEDWRKKKGDK